MKHSVLSCMLFLIVLAVIGCTKSPTTQPKAPPATDGGGKKSVAADTTKQLPGPAPVAPAADTSAAETAKGAPAADTTPGVPPADTKKMDTPPGRSGRHQTPLRGPGRDAR